MGIWWVTDFKLKLTENLILTNSIYQDFNKWQGYASGIVCGYTVPE